MAERRMQETKKVEREVEGKQSAKLKMGDG
jgi:hypothetical protein